MTNQKTTPQRSRLLQTLLLLNAVLPNAFALDPEAPVFNALQGVWYKESKDPNAGLKYLSMAGGAPIVVQGAMMARMPNSNQIVFQSINLAGVEFEGPPLSEGDINFSTNTAEGRLGYSLPSVMTLFNQDYSSFNGETLPNGSTGTMPYIGFDLKILSHEDNWYVACGARANCQLLYSRDYTPLLMAVTPSNVCKDQLIQFHVNAKNTQSKWGTPADEWPFREIKLDETFVMWTNGDFDGGTVTQDQRLPGYSRGTIEAYVGKQFPTKNSEPKLMFYPGYAYNQPTAKSCNFVGDDCWTVRAHARIDSISDSTGYTNGGQSLTINGWGLRSQDVQVEIDGVPCQVTKSNSNEQLTCVTGKASADSDTWTQRPGQPGLLRQKLKTDDNKWPQWVNFTNANLYPVVEKNLITSFEVFSHQQDVNYGQKLSGWFVSPATANYRFYMSCDDNCRLLIDSTNPLSSGTAPSPQVIATRGSWTSWRNYFHDVNAEGINQNHRSDWIALVKGESYYIEGQHIQATGGEHFTVSVEIELPEGNPVDHPKQNVQIQQLSIEQVNTPEQWSITITNPDTGSYKLNFLNPTTTPASLAGPYGPISMKASAWEFKNAIAQYYRQNFGTEITVTLTMTDVNAVTTTDASVAKYYTYQVTLQRQIVGISINSISATKSSSNATITVTPPLKGIKSSAPISGNYTISCTDQNKKQWTTPNIQYNTGHNWIQNQITNFIPFLADKVEVLPDYRYRYWENGVSFMIKFTGINGDVTPCTIQSGTTFPITGNSPDFSNNTVLMQANKTLMFEPIPMEFLRTNTMTPQVLVKLDGQPALCPNLTCDFTYYSDSAAITAQVKSGSNGLQLSVTGTDIPYADILKVSYGEVDCEVTSSSATNIDCNLADIPVAGTQAVKVFTPKGMLPIDPVNFQPTMENLVVNSVTPNTDVNYLGGDILVFAGSGFGTVASAVDVKFDDGTVCEVLNVMSTYFSCQTERFSASAISPLTVQIKINDARDVSQTIQLLAQAQTSESVTPSRVSPVLKQNIQITLSSNYSRTVDINDLSVYLINDNEPKNLKKLYIIRVDDTQKTLTVKFPGARSGNYRLRVVSEYFGRIDTDSLRLTVIGQVLDFQPKQGSIYGGTTITITGENFSEDPLDNPVMIGKNYCYVETTTATQITCKTDLLYDEHVGQEELIVFLKTSEEAECNVNSGCIFDYKLPEAAVTDVLAAFNPTSQKQIATVSGSGLDSSLRLILDGKEQNQLPGSSDTSVQFEIVDLHDTNITHVEVLTSEGYPEGATSLPYLLLTPSLLSISPLVGSAGGSKVVVTGTGFGPDTKGLNLFNSLTNKAICSEVKVVSYGVFTCLTVAGEISDGSGIQLQYGTKKFTSQLPSATSYTQVASVTISSVQLSADLSGIEFTGTGFAAQGFVAVASFGGIDADNTAVVSDTQVTATWLSTGVAAVTAKPVLRLINTSNPNIINFAQNNAATLTKTLTIVPDSSSQTVSCSFQGGCSYSVSAEGLFAALKDPANKIDVCGRSCIVDETQSNPSTTVCRLPALSTAYSIKNFKTQADGILSGTVFPNTKVLTDGVLTVDYVDSAKTGCNFGMNFPSGQVGILSEAKVFINYMVSHTPYVNNLAFYGSNDNWVSSTLIETFGENVHEGWNYFDFGDEGNSRPAYNSYKFIGKSAGSCRVTEFKLIGVQTILDSNPTYSCTPKVTIGSSTPVDLSPVTFSDQNTPLLTNIWPRFGSVLGGDTITLTGENFSSSALTTVKLDDRVCTVVSQSDTQIVCTTANKPYVPDTPKVEIYIEGQGLVATQGLVFIYASLWSEPQTWGFDIPPQHHESISIPKGQHLLVDVDETPEVFAVIVEGSLLFAPNADPTHHRKFDAHYIMIQGGYMEVGTEEFPYTSHITITMHGNKYSPSLPIFGNKVLSVHYGRLEMHGVTRDVTWTRLNQTANAGDTQLVLDDEVDWLVGEEIVLAGTVFEPIEFETRFITEVNGNTITIDRPLDYTHIGQIPKFGQIEMPMKGEVGLLTRNVLYRGNPDTSPVEQYGATIMVHSPGDDTSIARICYVEFKDVGQAFKLGRYPIHFHMIGHVMESHVIGNAIHQTYNRAITTHGVHYFHVQHNVAFDTMGHTFFIEDAIETNNYFDHNLAIKIASSFSLLNTDVTPGGFWITHPNNIFTNNAIANSDAYGFWFDMKKTSIGPSFDINVCGFNDKLGRFYQNTAHSVHKYGLRIFHGLIPRTYPCRATPYDGDYLAKNKTDPYWQNPIIPAIFEDSVFWRNGHAGAIMERSGAVQFKNLRCAENGIANIEWSLSEDIADGYAKISGGLVVGDTGTTQSVTERLRGSLISGVITPRTENFTVEGVTFYNFDWSTAQALKDCSHCWHPASTDSGSRTVTTSNLTFDDASVPRRIRYEIPLRGIWYDLDGTLTGLGPKTWATKDFPHNRQPECQLDDPKYNGLICDSTIQVRRIVFHGYTPSALDAMLMRVAQWDDTQVAEIKADNTTLFNFQQDKDAKYFSKVQWRQKLDPFSSWPVPFVTGHKYRLHFGWANDFDIMTVTPSNRWVPEDKNVHIMTNFTDVRVGINVTSNPSNSKNNQLIANTTYLTKTEEELLSGDNVIFNQTEVREFKFVINGKDMINRNQFKLQGFRCWPGQCTAPVIIKPINESFVYWSDANSWPSKKVPVADEIVTVGEGVNMVLDIDTPILKMLTIKGRLSFSNNGTAHDITLNSYIVFVAGGELIIGNETNPFNGTATVKLYGISTDQSFAFDSAIQGGNKMIANLGLVSMWGSKRDRISRLRQPCYWGNTSALVSPGLDWVAGDRLYLAPTAVQHTHSDYVNIKSYDNQTGLLTFDRELKYYHWGAYQSTAQDYNGVDTRGEVVLLSRNVRVIGDDTMSWGGQIVTADTLDELGTLVSGQLLLSNVEVYNCSQANTYQSAIRFEGAQTKSHLIQNTVVHEGQAWTFSAVDSQNILVKDSDFIGGQALGLVMKQVQNITLDGVMVADIVKRKLDLGGGTNYEDPAGCISVCALDAPHKCNDVSIVNSIAAGCIYAGFIVQGHKCGTSATQQAFRDNVAHSIGKNGGGAIIYPDTSSEQELCYEGSHFAAYKCEGAGFASMFITQRVIMNDVTMIDNVMGMSMQTGQEMDINSIEINRAFIYGETEAQDCPDPSKESKCECTDKMGFMLSGGNMGPKKPHIIGKSGLPLYKIKSYGAWNVVTNYKDVNFENFKSNLTSCGARQTVFGLNPYSSDHIPLQKFTNSKFVNVADEAMAYIYDPPEAWNNPDDCLGFPCTAPSNVVIQHDKVSYSGLNKPKQTAASFQIVSDTKSSSENLDSCTFKEAWNGWTCQNSFLGVLEFKSLDVDQEQRNVSPVYVYSDETGFNNTLNIMMDHTWDGFYTGQLHKAQFASMIETQGNYTVLYTSTPPKHTRYTLRADRGAIKVKVQYWTAGTYAVKVNGETVANTPWNKTAGSQSELTGLRGCGENRFVGVKNFLEFWITAGCEIEVVPVEAILANVRMQWTLSEFYAQGGVVSFADRVAGALGIQAYQVKTVAVYQGSVVVQYTVTTAKEEKDTPTSLSKISKKLNALVSSPSATKVFGAPILNATTNSQTIVGGTPKPTPTTTGGATTVVTPAPIIQDTSSSTSVTNQQQQVTVATSQPTESKKDQTQVIVIVIVVLVLAIVVAVAVGVFVKNRMRKNIQEASTASQAASGQGAVGIQNSEIALEPQFDAADFDVDIFTNKKRAIKKFNDDEVASKYYDNNDQFSSNMKLSVTDMSSKIELTDVKKPVAK